jgi:hypothetical protein
MVTEGKGARSVFIIIAAAGWDHLTLERACLLIVGEARESRPARLK